MFNFDTTSSTQIEMMFNDQGNIIVRYIAEISDTIIIHFVTAISIILMNLIY